MRIGIVHPALSPQGGAERTVLQLARALSARGHEITCFTTAVPEPIADGVRSVLLPRRPAWIGERLHSRWVGARIRRQLPELDLLLPHNAPAPWWALDALGSSGSAPPILWYCQEPNRRAYFSLTEAWTSQRVAALPASLPRREVILARARDGRATEQMLRRRISRRIDRRLLPRLDAVATNSGYSAGLIERIHGLRAEVIPPGLVGPLGPPLPSALRSGLVCVTSRHPWKNAFAYVGVLAALRRLSGRSDIPLHVIGPVDAEALRAEARGLGVADQLVLCGAVSEAEKQAQLGAARLCVSLPLGEPFGLVPVEAMALGTPVVASDFGGPAEVVEPGVTGMLADPLDPDSAARRVLELYDDEARWQRMSANARTCVARIYTLERFAAQVESLAQRVLGSPQSRPGDRGS